ncbi:hypothetical protein FAM09_09195 [Niastella caeni]|uniref:BZIP transcription factor n=1 Tax=Niastella caeni TaxID=2569763 RepID=A0A4S8HYZ5_9BACT|nr:cell division protein ZapB [Niastella caeni]THU40049.1 hypothetical protein FAM09_09195 [Niastella caeni]
MFKTSLTAIFGVIVLQTGAMAQVYVKNTGNVGIGTQTPATKLDVNGIVTAGNAGGGYHLIVNDIPTARWALGTGNHAFHIANDYPVTTTWAEKFVISRDGNVGIGVTNPSAKLELPNNGAASLRVGVSSNMANTHTQLLNSLAVVGEVPAAISSSGAVASDFFNNGNSPTWAGTLLFHYGSGLGQGYLYPNVPVDKRNLGVLHFQNQSNGLIVASGGLYLAAGYNLLATLHANGNVGIGTDNPAYKLHVNGTVWGNNFITSGGYGYPDYVFDSTYQLPTLQQVETYIKQNHHLPEVPSEAEVKKDGINLREHHVILLKKVEELTLYAIEQNKKQQEQNERLKQLEEKMAVMMEENNKLKEELANSKTKKKARCRK